MGCKEKGKSYKPKAERKEILETETDLQVSWQCSQWLRELSLNNSGDVERYTPWSTVWISSASTSGITMENSYRKILLFYIRKLWSKYITYLFHSHDNFNRIQTVQAKVVGERRRRGQL